MIRCEVKVTKQNGKVHIYKALFKTTIDAAQDAIQRFGAGVKIYVVAE